MWICMSRRKCIGKTEKGNGKREALEMERAKCVIKLDRMKDGGKEPKKGKGRAWTVLSLHCI